MLWRFGTILTTVFIATAFSGVQSTASFAQEIELSLPLACDLGKDCFVQNFVDIDPGDEVQTVACKPASYDGHKGTDFRLLNTQITGDVLASAPGTVKAVRNDMPDKLVVSMEDRVRVRNKECGNGVVVDHGGGWETQYCHLRKGSVLVNAGDQLDRGQKLGEVGYSGFAAFPHVHLSLRKDGKTVDPFIGAVERSAKQIEVCASGDNGKQNLERSLWQTDTELMLEDALGSIIQLGFSDGPVTTLNLEQGLENAPSGRSPALVFFARLINLQQGDRIAMRLVGPQGVLAETEGKPIESQKAQWVAFSGRKLRTNAWPSGEYVGTATLVRDGKAFREETARFQLED
ncbi:MAG: M23 family metallopeptidase [Roseibium sp.]|uniref:M23 family metallopeptidase n=1 Tax=Roseibium sp. TaxID=1936156 RepID=UPI00261B0620|nr:M23 family metallopeptidase [Roseibium sp.]MCV0426902.1 M23 family metallopeptidase [Roseibium sp.]